MAITRPHLPRRHETYRKTHLELLEDRRVLATISAADDFYVVSAGATLSAGVSGLKAVYEDFSGPALSPDLSGPGFFLEDGSIHRTTPANHNDRQYLRTSRSDYVQYDFTAELTVYLPNHGDVSIVFFGLGEGLPNGANQEPASGVFLRMHAADTADGIVGLADRPSHHLSDLGNVRQQGTHRLRLVKTGSNLQFLIDENYDGDFHADLAGETDLSLIGTSLTAANSRIFFGTAWSDVRFDDFFVSVRPSPGVLANDSADDNGTLTASVLEAPTHGDLTLETDGSFLYTPAPGFHGEDTFRYRASLSEQASAMAIARIVVAPTSARPIAVDDHFEVQEDTALLVGSVITDFHKFPLPAGAQEIVYSPARDRFYAAVSPSGAGGGVYVIDPATGLLPTPIDVGGNANQLAVSDDGHYLYVGIDAARAIRRVNLDTGEVSSAVILGSTVRAEDIEVPPGQPDTVFVSLARVSGSPRAAGVAVYDNLVRRTNPGLEELNNNFAFNDNGSRAVGFRGEASNRSATILAEENGTWQQILQREFFIPGNPEGEIQWSGQYIYFHSGQVFAADTLQFVGMLPYGSSVQDVATGQFYSVDRNEIVVSSAADLSEILRFRIPEIPAKHGQRDLTRIGTDGLALRSAQNELIVFRTSLVSEGLEARGVLVNDTFQHPLPSLVRVATPPEHGSLELLGDGSVRYVPNSNFFGSDSFEYVIVEPSGESVPAHVTIDVLPTNDAPVAQDDQFHTGQNRTLLVTQQQGLLSNDFDPDGDGISVQLEAPPQHGELDLAADGSFRYTPLPGFVGSDSFRYEVTDGNSLSEPATVELVVESRSLLVSLRALSSPSTLDQAEVLPDSLEQVDVGDDYVVEVWVQNILPSATGVAGGQVNLLFDTAKADGVSLSHGGLFNQLATGTLAEQEGRWNAFGGGTLSAGAGVAPAWARLGYVSMRATDQGPATYAATISTLQFSLVGEGNVAWPDVDLSETVTVAHQAGAELLLTMVAQATATDSVGQTGQLPTSTRWIDEWTPYWVEVWSRSSTADTGVSTIHLDLGYATQHTSATQVQPGPAWDPSTFSGTIDDAAGLVHNLGGQLVDSVSTDPDQWLLLARILFEPRDADQTLIDPLQHFVGPYSAELQILEPDVRLSNIEGSVPTVLTDRPSTEIWNVVYDVDDNNWIDFGDLALFAPVFGQAVSSERPLSWWADFDRSANVDFGDFSYFSQAFGLDRSTGPAPYPPGYPDSWRAAPLPEPSTAGDGSIDQLSPVPQPASMQVRLIAVSNPTASDQIQQLPVSLSEVSVGQTYHLEVWVQDVSEAGPGVTGGQIDVHYSSDRLTWNSLDHGQIFTTFATGSVDTDTRLIDNFGGGTIAGHQGSAPNWARLGRASFTVAKRGRIEFDVLPGLLSFSLFGQGNLSWEAIDLAPLVLNRLGGDADGDGDVDSVDLGEFLANWTGALEPGTGNRTFELGDLDEDGDVDSNDLGLFLTYWTGSLDASLGRPITSAIGTDVPSESAQLVPAAADVVFAELPSTDTIEAALRPTLRRRLFVG